MKKTKRLKNTGVEAPPDIPGFLAIKPKKGQWLVSMKREKIYGQVTAVYDDQTYKWSSDHGSIVEDSRGWEVVQYDWGEMRFVDEIPEGFTKEGNGWRRADG